MDFHSDGAENVNTPMQNYAEVQKQARARLPRYIIGRLVTLFCMVVVSVS